MLTQVQHIAVTHPTNHTGPNQRNLTCGIWKLINVIFTTNGLTVLSPLPRQKQTTTDAISIALQ